MSYVYQAWPAWRWGPSGEGKIFERAEDVPEGWTDTPPAPDTAVAPAQGTDPRADADRASDLVAKFQAERDKLVEGMTELGYPEDGGPEDATPVDKALFALAGVLDDRERLKAENDELRAQMAPVDGDNDGKPGGLRGERKDLMKELKAAGIPFKPTLSTAALRALLPATPSQDTDDVRGLHDAGLGVKPEVDGDDQQPQDEPV